MNEIHIIVGITISLVLIFLGRKTAKDESGPKVNLMKNVLDHEKEKSKTTVGVMGASIKDLVSRANDRLRKRRDSGGKNP